MVGCYDNNDFISGELGTEPVNVDVIIDFEPLEVTQNKVGGTRTPGNAHTKLENLVVFLYKGAEGSSTEGELYDIRYHNELNNLNISQKEQIGANEVSPYDNKGESTTARATFKLTNVDPGYYYIYAVANVGEEYIPGVKSTALERFANADNLKKINLTWKSDDISANNQMFGYMTSGDITTFSDGFEAAPVGIGINANKLHCWLKRASSKVTVVFDGSGLKDNIRIHIKKVTIKDIPNNCYLGADSKIEDNNGMIPDGESLYYNSEGVLSAGTVNDDPDWRNWLTISNGSGRKGAVSINEEGEEELHSEYAEALYFFENLQGAYPPDDKDHSKLQDWDKLGWIPENPDQPGYKDNVPLGSYLEIEAYYESNNANNVSQGDIKYRFMLGQDIYSDFNYRRNHHYKVTLGFKGYANQPDWHIAYREEGEVFVTVNNYYMSYQYNRKSIFPIRVKGDVKELTVEIVENNWAPYQENSTSDPSDDVPPGLVGANSSTESVVLTRFTWNKEVYDNNSGKNFYYGLQTPWSQDGSTNNRQYSAAEKQAGAPEKVTPIWAGFMALTVPGDSRDRIPTNMFPVGENYDYFNTEHIKYLKDYYYGKGGHGDYVNNVPQNIRTFTAQDLKFAEGETSKKVGDGNNTCIIQKAPDGTLTIFLPIWSRPKILLGISGFSGNNPYDAYRRRGKVMITAKFSEGSNSTSKVVVKDVFQVRRVVNPKGIWHKHDNADPFHVEICCRDGAETVNFTTQKSDGAWRAYVQTTNGHDFLRLVGGIKNNEDTIIGATDTPIEFDIQFKGTVDYGNSYCALVRVEYHGYTCGHTIFVRQGYRTPLAVKEGGAEWSSFSLYGCKTNEADVNDQFSVPKNGNNYIEATITASPLALGSLFKRGNYNGFRIINNRTYGATIAPNNGIFEMSNGKTARWRDVKGLAYSKTYTGLSKWDANDKHNTFEWRQFKAEIVNPDNNTTFTRIYRVPDYKDFADLLDPSVDSATGVMYADGTTGTQKDVDYAYGYEDFYNTGKDSNTTNENGGRGMRGIILYNIHNAHQLFFPIGARGIGRRTITGFSEGDFNNFGTLRYGGVNYLLSYDKLNANQYRPIPYDMIGAPGAIYWFNKVQPATKGDLLSWDMNYFDQNFNAYDYATSFSTNYTGTEFGSGGDALPIKLVKVKDE